MVKNRWGLIDHRNVKPGVSQKWFDEMSRLKWYDSIKWFFCADSDGIAFVFGG